MSWRNCPVQRLRPGRPLDFPSILMCHRHCQDTHREAKGTALCWQSLPQEQCCLFTHSSHPCFPPLPPAVSLPTCSCTAGSFRTHRGLLSITQQLAVIPSSMRQPSTYNILQQGTLQINHTVLNTLLTNFDVSQLLYKLLPRVASWTTL